MFLVCPLLSTRQEHEKHRFHPFLHSPVPLVSPCPCREREIAGTYCPQHFWTFFLSRRSTSESRGIYQRLLFLPNWGVNPLLSPGQRQTDFIPLSLGTYVEVSLLSLPGERYILILPREGEKSRSFLLSGGYINTSLLPLGRPGQNLNISPWEGGPKTLHSSLGEEGRKLYIARFARLPCWEEEYRSFSSSRQGRGTSPRSKASERSERSMSFLRSLPRGGRCRFLSLPPGERYSHLHPCPWGEIQPSSPLSLGRDRPLSSLPPGDI